LPFSFLAYLLFAAEKLFTQQVTMLSAAATTLLLASSGDVVVDDADSDFARTIAARGTHSGNPVSPIDLRITPAMGSRKTDVPGSLVRVSVITNVTAPLTSEGMNISHTKCERGADKRS